MNSIVSINDLSKQELLSLLDAAAYFEAHPNHKILDGMVVATLFFEPSTRSHIDIQRRNPQRHHKDG